MSNKFTNLKCFMVAVFLTASLVLEAQPTLPNTPCNFLTRIGGIASTNGAEIPAYDPASKRVYTVAGKLIEYFTMSNSGALTLGGSLPIGFTVAATDSAIPNSVAVSNGILAASYAVIIKATNAQQPGRVTFYNASTGAVLNSVTVGYLPDMVVFTPDGTKILTANEAEPNSYGAVTSFDPEGSVSIIDISGGVASATVQNAGFTSFNAQAASLRAAGVRIYGPGATVAQDFEPEYIAFSADGTKAWVTLQENNAFAVVDIATATVTNIIPLGLKDHSIAGNGLDANDRDVNGTTAAPAGGKINIQNWPVFGMYQPDAIAQFTVAGQTYFITANEGDARDWPGYAEEVRVGAALLDPTVFPNRATLQQNINLGRLTGTRATGDTDGDGDIDQIHILGARSFSIWNSSGALVYDSKDQLEVITSILTPTTFNSDGLAATFDTRSDNKGPEPEGVVVGVIDGVPYAFVGSERTGDIFVYNVSNPLAPVFVQYINTPEDNGVEGLTFVTAANSPTGKPLLITTAEVSRTLSVYEVNIPTIAVTETSGLVNNDGEICAGASATLTVSGNAPYVWSTGATTPSITVNPGSTTTYSVSACYLTASKTITVNPVNSCSITAVPSNNIYTGGVVTNLYLGYGPQQLKLNVSASASGAPYTYAWSGGTLSNYNSANPVFTATTAGSYTFTCQITNKFGCVSTCSITVCVTDIRVPHSFGTKVYICVTPPHFPQYAYTLPVNVYLVPILLRYAQGVRLGKCSETPCSTAPGRRERVPEPIVTEFSVKAFPNPSAYYFNIIIQSNKAETVEVRVTDLQGRRVYNKRVAANSNLNFGSELINGIYILEVIQGTERKTLKLIKQ